MRITFQPSGGRGEYELSDYAPNGLMPSDLLELSVRLLIGEFVLDTGVKLTKAQGKYRLRRVYSQGAYPQVQIQLANLLLMPHPIREEPQMGGGELVLQNSSYIIKNIQFGNVVYTPETSFFTAEVLTVECKNQTIEAEQVATLKRMADIEKIWKQRSAFPPDIASLLSQHEEYVKATLPIPQAATTLVQQLQNHMERYSSEIEIPYTATTDVVPALLSALGEILEEMPTSLDQIEPEQMELRFRERKKWQIWASRRGAASVRFRKEVPATKCNDKPGIDAAHILPWAVYDLDKIYNGVTLCKLHHWAFDEGILLIVSRGGKYYIELSEAAKNNLREPEFSIDYLQQVVGEIPRRYLPAKTTDWPDSNLLERRNAEFANQPLSSSPLS